MLLFIGLPIISSFFQSLHIEPEQILMEVEKCDPFGCKTETKVDIEATTKLQEEQPLGRFNGLGTYGDRNHLAFDEIKEAWTNSSSIAEFTDILLNLPFYKALLFTLTFCFHFLSRYKSSKKVIEQHLQQRTQLLAQEP